MCDTSTYTIWEGIIQRCKNTKNKAYLNYGGRGISVCEEWTKFENFYKDMGERPNGLTIERKNNELGYFKENCCWATWYKQNQNQRPRLDNTTNVAGCSWHKQAKKYQVRINANNKRYNVGLFKTIEGARMARKQAEQKYWGQI